MQKQECLCRIMTIYQYISLGVKWSFIGIVFLMVIPISKSNETTKPIDDELIIYFDSLGEYYCGKDLDSTIFFYKKLQAVFGKQKAWKDYADVNLDIATCAFNNRVADSMYMYLQRFQEATKQYQIPKNDALFIQYHQSLGVFYYQKGDFQQAIEQTEKALKIQNELNLTDSTSSTEIYLNLGMMSIQSGDYSKAVDFFNYSTQFAPHNWKREKHYALAIAYNNLGLAFINQKKYNKAKFYYQKALGIYQHPINQNNDILKTSTPNVLGNLAQVFTEIEQYDSASLFLNQALRHPSYKRVEGGLYNFLGYNDLKRGNYKQALKHLNIALNKRIIRFGWKQPRITSTLNHIGNTYFELGDFEKALQFYQKSLTSGLVDFNDSLDVSTNPSLTSILSERYVLNALIGKAKTFKQSYHQTQDIQSLKKALENYQLAIQLIEISRRGYKAEGSKQFLTESALPVFEQAIETAYLLHQQTQETEYINVAFQFAEQNKAVLLLEALKDADAKTFANIPDTLLAKERQLRLDLTHYEKKLYRAQRLKDSVAIAEATDYLFRIGEEYDYFIEALEADYPEYYQLKYNTQVATIEAIQSDLLLDDEGFIEYFMGDSSLFVFSITANQTDLLQVKKEAIFDTLIQDFRHNLTDAKTIQTNLQQSVKMYGTLGYDLYETLLQSSIEDMPKNIMLVPDGNLGYIPFEALIHTPYEQGDNFQTLEYLIQDYNIAYAYSATFLLDMLQRKTQRNTQKGYGGFAAAYESEGTLESSRGGIAMRNGIAPLPNAIKEVEAIATMTNGTAYVKDKASERNFKNNASQYQILHFSMHGFLDDQNPMFSYLQFTPTTDTLEDDQLTALEIYNLNINAELAVLSACNTGFGTIRKGEGVMSLSRAFAYAGCPSLVMSLWSVPDRSTSEIMTQFYQNLIQVNTFKHDALRQAKLTYLEETDALLAHPLFWAGFVPMGDMRPIELQQPLAWWIWGIGGLVVLGLLFFVSRKY